jgi:DNA-binding CsgD family transcriptional regulator
MELAFAGLQQLSAPFLDRIDRLPGPQSDALATALGLRGGDSPDRFLVGLAVLSLFSDVAEELPLVCLLDDAHWLDQASTQVLGFVARRLAKEAVVLVFALRQPGEHPNLAGLPELAMRPLDDSDARTLLDSQILGKVDDLVLDRMVAEAHGNPLALLELSRELTPAALAGGFGFPDGASVPARIEETYRQRLAVLPDPARKLLLVAAAETTGDSLLIWHAAERLGIPASAAAAAEAEGLLAIEQRATFRHPLVRSCAYQAATPAERQAVHLALAEVIESHRDPDRRAWHLAAAADGTDEGIALELERSADRARSRGGFTAAAAFMQRAVALTGDPARRAARALAAAQTSLRAGAFDAARQLLADAEAGPLDEFERARVAVLQAEVSFAQNRGGDASLLLLRAARKLEPLDIGLSRNTYLDAWGAALFAGHLASDGGGLRDVSRAAATAPQPMGRLRPSDLLLDGLAVVFTDGRPAAAPLLKRAVAAFASSEVSTEEVLRWGWLASRAANLVWDYDRSLEIGTRAVRLARELGAIEVLAVADNATGQAAVLGGDFASALLLISEVEAVNAATATRIDPYAAIALAGVSGDEHAASELVKGTINEGGASGQGTAVQYAHWAMSVLLNGLGRYHEALSHAREASGLVPELFISSWSLSELIEAASRTGNIELAHDALFRLAEHTGATDADWGLGLYARSGALVEEGETAEGLYLEAIDRLQRTSLRPDLARAHLLYGEWLRRENRRVDARQSLRTAHDMLATVGMEAFAERARRELLATGERVRKRSEDTRFLLTPQEEQIARLARAGLSNAEIGARLYISPRTVEWHLHKVFAKLGVASRKGLEAALSKMDRQAVLA